MSMPNLSVRLNEEMSLEMVPVEGGSFRMGEEDSKYDRERPVHQVTVPGFYLGKFPVTQEEWVAVMGENPSAFEGERNPVERVSWSDARKFIEKLNRQTRRTFRLPAEAEWEYACRGGRLHGGYLYSGSDKLKQVGWYEQNSGNSTREVGELLANELGIYDMCGNIWEWCEDDWHGSYDGAPEDGSAWIDRPKRGANRVFRGGSYLDDAGGCRPAYRNGIRPDNRYHLVGFRLALSPQSVG